MLIPWQELLQIVAASTQNNSKRPIEWAFYRDKVAHFVWYFYFSERWNSSSEVRWGEMQGRQKNSKQIYFESGQLQFWKQTNPPFKKISPFSSKMSYCSISLRNKKAKRNVRLSLIYHKLTSSKHWSFFIISFSMWVYFVICDCSVVWWANELWMCVV